MQRRLRLRDLHLGGGEAATQRPLGQVPREERLAGAVLPADRLERSSAAGDGVQLIVQSGREAVESDGEQVEAALRHGAAPERGDHLAAASGGHLWRHERTSNWSSRSAWSRMTTPVAGSAASTG